MNYRILLVPLFISVFFAQPAFASDHGGCGDKSRKTTQKTIVENYSTKVSPTSYDKKEKMKSEKSKSNTPHELKLQMIKTYLKKFSKNDLEKFNERLDYFSKKVPSTNPNYYMIGELKSYIDSLMNGMTMSSKSIVDVVVENENVSILKDVVVALDLVDTLSSEGPFTVFAPTNAAFEKLLSDLDMSFDELASNQELLKTVVLYHVVGSKVPSSAVLGLTEGTLVETVGGESLRVSNWNGVKVDTSNVISADIMTSNGIIHLVDEVLLPPSVRKTLGLPTDRGDENIVTTAVENGGFPTLIAAVQAAGLVETLSGEGQLTVYAPTEEAFANLLADLNMSAEELLGNTDLLTKVLTYHVVPGFYTSEDIVSLPSPMQSPTAQGSSLTINPNNGSPMVNDSTIIATDVYATNGVIHVIDKVLLPAM